MLVRFRRLLRIERFTRKDDFFFLTDERKVLRGEVWWVCVDDSVGAEQQTGRPALIVSGNKNNEKWPTVIVAYMTQGAMNHNSVVGVNVNGRIERVVCNQLRTIDKQRLTRYVGKVSDSDLRRVSGGLAISMCIPTSLGTIPAEQNDENEEIISLRAEADMWKRLYERTMDQLVELKVANDLAMKVAQRVVPVIAEQVVGQVAEPVAEVDEATEPPKEEPVVAFEETPEKVDLNSCTSEDLKKCGCTAAMAETIIAGRPYKFVEDLRKIPGITNVAYRILECKVCVEEPAVAEVTEEAEVVETPVAIEAPVEVAAVTAEIAEKVNINTATVKEMVEKLDLSQAYAYKINGHRNKHGHFIALEEIVEYKVISRPAYEKIKDRITIGEAEPEVEENWLDNVKLPQPPSEEEAAPTEEPKLNVNTAKPAELMALGFSKAVASRIAAHVKKFGPYRNLDELLEIEGMRGKTLRKLRDKLEV